MKTIILLSLFALNAMAAEEKPVSPGTVTPVAESEPEAKPFEGGATKPFADAPKTPRVISIVPRAPQTPPTQAPAAKTTPVINEAPETPAVAETEAFPEGPITLYAAGNYRLRAREWGRVQLVIPKGKSFEVIGRAKKGFYLVRYNGKIGYIYETGLDHPLAAAIKAQKGMTGLKRFEAAEIAACMAVAPDGAIAPDMKDFFQRLQASLESYRDKEPKSEPAPAPGRVISAAPKKVAVAPPAARPATVAPALRASAAPAAPAARGEDVLVPIPPPRPSKQALKAAGDEGDDQHLLPKPAPKKEYRPKAEDPASAGVNPSAVQRLSRAADRAARKCRQYARFICQRRGLCGTSCNPGKSKGMCKAGVRETLQEAIGFNLPGGSARESNAALARSPKFTKISATDCDSAPVGAICVYDAKHHGFGHIEVKAGANKYCSDYCAARPVSKRSYKVRAIYVPRYDS